MSTVLAQDSAAAAPDDGALMSDTGLFNLIALGMIVGTPILFVVAVLIAYVSGVGVGNALAIGIIPAMFGGVTFGGFIALMRLLRREDKADAAARAVRRATATRESATRESAARESATRVPVAPEPAAATAA